MRGKTMRMPGAPTVHSIVPLLVVVAAAASVAAAARADSGTTDPIEQGSPDVTDFDLADLLQTKVFTAARDEQDIALAAAVITVITRDQILLHQVRSVAEALQMVPGLYVNEDYVLYDVGVRGVAGGLRGGSRMIKVMIDGQPVSFRSEAIHLLGPEAIPIDTVERIEVVRGPGSALYGANAFLGVVNIITRDGADLDGAYVRIDGTAFDMREFGGGISLGAGKRLGPLDLLLAVAYHRTNRSGQSIRCTTAIEGESCDDVAHRPADLWERESEDDLAQPMSALGRLDLDLGQLTAPNRELDIGHINLLGNLQLLDSRGSFSDWGTMTHVGAASGAESGRGTGNRVSLSNATFRGRYDLDAADGRFKLAAGGAHARGSSTDREQLVDREGRVIHRRGYGYRSGDAFVMVTGVPVRDLMGGGDRSVTAIDQVAIAGGADITRDVLASVADHTTTEYGRVELEYENIDLLQSAVWGQVRGQFVDDRIGLTVGLRYDSHRGAEVEPELIEDRDGDRVCEDRVCYRRLTYRFGGTFSILRHVHALRDGGAFGIDELYLKVLYGTAFQAPSPHFLYNDGYIGDVPLVNNLLLEPQDIRSFEAQLGGAHFGRRLTWSVVFFDNQIQGLAEFTREAGLSMRAENGAPVTSRGVEAEVELRHRPVAAHAGLSYQYSRRHHEDPWYGQIEETFAYPDWMAATGVRFFIPVVKLTFGAQVHYVGHRTGHYFNRSEDRGRDRYTLPPYALLDLDLATDRWELWPGRETRLAVSLRNVAGARYEMPGYQPYYRYDVPGRPRTLLLSVTQEF